MSEMVKSFCSYFKDSFKLDVFEAYEVTDRPFLSLHSSGGMECRVSCIDGNLILRELKYKEVGLEFDRLQRCGLEHPRYV